MVLLIGQKYPKTTGLRILRRASELLFDVKTKILPVQSLRPGISSVCFYPHLMRSPSAVSAFTIQGRVLYELTQTALGYRAVQVQPFAGRCLYHHTDEVFIGSSHRNGSLMVHRTKTASQPEKPQP